ncbi:LacI family transcriptional regulator, partial [bacterium]
LNGVMAALFPADYTLALCPRLMTGDDASPVSDGRFDGVLWCRPDLTETSVDLLQTASVPIVTMHAPPGAVPGVPAFCADNGGAMAKVAAHLKELGHRRVAFVIDLVNPHTVEGIVRREAFLTEMARAGLEGEILVWDEPYAEVAGFKTGIVPYTALVCFSDTVAGGILAACDRFGVSVPRDLSVIGFDSSSFCEGTRPRLTSVNQPVERMALAATRHLLDLIRDSAEGQPPAPTVSFVYDCGLDLRESTARPRTH